MPPARPPVPPARPPSLRRPPLDRLLLAGGVVLFLLAAGVAAWGLGLRPPFVGGNTNSGPARAWFSPTLSGPVEPAAPLRIEADVPDPDANRTGPRPLPYVYLTVRDAGGQPAIYGPGPADPQPMLLRGLPPVWSAEISAPTAPGTYHLQLQVKTGTQPTQTLDLATPLLTVVTPTTPLRSGLVYDRDGNLWLTAADGVRTRKLTFAPRTEQITEPAWSPDGQRIAYVHTLPLPDVVLPVREIAAIRPDGSDARVLVPRQEGEDLLYPAWTPDGQHLLVTVDRVVDPTTGGTPTTERIDQGRESWSIDEVDLANGARRPLVADARMADVSRDGTHLVYVALPPSRAETEQVLTRTLMLADRDGSHPRVLVPGDVYQDIRLPRFSPDGRQIAFAAVNPEGWTGARDDWWAWLAPPVAANGVPWDIYVVDVAGGAPRRVTRFQADLPTVAWGADPGQLAVLTERNLFLVPLDGTPPRPLAPGALHGGLSWYAP
jgi:hypothetical protein